MSGQLSTFLSLGAENLGKGKSGSVAEAPSAPVRHSPTRPQTGGHSNQGSFGSLWNSIRGKKVKGNSLKSEWLGNEAMITSPQSQLPPISRGLYGLDVPPNGGPGRLDSGFAFPSPSVNESQQSLRQTKSFLNLSHSDQVQSASRHEGYALHPNSAGIQPSLYLGRFTNKKNMATSSSMPYDLSSHVHDLSGSDGGLLRPSESTPNLRHPASESMERWPSAATTNDIIMPRHRAPSAQSTSQHLAPPPMVSQYEHQPKPPTNRPSTNKWTTSSQLYPPTSRWMTAGACEQFVLPRPKLVAHPVSPPGSPENADRVIVIGNEYTRITTDQGESAVVPLSEGAKVLLAIDAQKAEREKWQDVARNGRGARFRSLSLSGGSNPTYGSRPSNVTSTVAPSRVSLEPKPRSRAGSLGHLFSSLRRASRDAPVRLVPARSHSTSSARAGSPLVSKSFGFKHGGRPAGRDSQTSHPFVSAWKAPMGRERTRTASEDVTDRDAQRLGISPRKANLYPHGVGNLPHSASSPNLNGIISPDHDSKQRQRDDEGVLVIGRSDYHPSTQRANGTRSLDEKPLPAIPNAFPPTLLPIQRDPFQLSDSLPSSTRGSDSDMPSPISAALNPVSPSKSQGGIDRERARIEIQKAHQRQLAQRAFLPMRQGHPPSMLSAASPRASPTKASASSVDAYDPVRSGAMSPEPLSLTTAMALASRSASSSRRKKSSIEEAVSRARMSDARSPTSPVFSEGSVYSHGRNPSNGSDHASILEAAGIIPASDSPVRGHRASRSMDATAQLSPLRFTFNSQPSDPTARDDSRNSMPISLGPPLTASSPSRDSTSGTSDSQNFAVWGSPSGHAAASRQLDNRRHATQKDRMLLDSPASTSGTSPGNSPYVYSSFGDPENFQDLFYSQPSREWGSPLTQPQTPPGKVDHARSRSAPSVEAFVPVSGGYLSGLGLVDREPQADSTSSQEHSDDGEAENFAIEIATPVVVSSRPQSASLTFMNLVDPAGMGTARLSNGMTDPRTVLGDEGHHLGDKEELTPPAEIFERQLSTLFSGSPALSLGGGEVTQESSPEVGGGQLNWRNSILETSGQTPVRIRTVSAQYPTQSGSSATFTTGREHIRNQPSHSSIIPELGVHEYSDEALATRAETMTTPPRHPSGQSIATTPRRGSTPTSSTADGEQDSSSRFSIIDTFPTPPGTISAHHSLARPRSQSGMMDDDDGIEQLRRLGIPPNPPNRGESGVGALEGHDFRDINLQALTSSIYPTHVHGSEDEDQADTCPNSHTHPYLPHRPEAPRSLTDASTASFVTATEGDSEIDR